ncbi:MAG: hypothetical protein M3Q60_16115 [Actinomycetota bacterium]|nr:hypothetical protein [Actinomycetota bacterium]
MIAFKQGKVGEGVREEAGKESRGSLEGGAWTMRFWIDFAVGKGSIG